MFSFYILNFFICRWALKMIMNLRNYYARRNKSSIIIQKQIRMFISKCRLNHLKRRKASIIIQCRIRQYRSRQKRLYLYQYKAAMKIQMKFRCFYAHKRRILLRNKWFASVICVWYLHQKWRVIRKKVRNMIRLVYNMSIFLNCLACFSLSALNERLWNIYNEILFVS